MRAADEVVRAFVFTDIEGSTRAWQADEETMRLRLVAHDRIARDVVDGRSGTIFKHTGDGCIAVFSDGVDAVAAAVEMHGALAETGLRVRVGAHLGPAVERDGDWFGLTLNRCARIMAAAHGGQTLVSGAMAADVEPLAVDLVLHPLGRHLLRDLDEPEDLFQVEPAGSWTAFPPPRTVVPIVGLPIERSSFVGRRDDVAHLAERIDAHRLVTVAGVGGTGKTRLAIRAAADAQVSFPGGAAFVDLTSVGDPDRLIGTLARAVGAPNADTAGAGDHDELATFIGYRRLLVVIDNAEHLVDDVAMVADLLLDRCPRLHLLVTSREPLGIEGEVVQRVAPLPTDDAVALFRARLGGEAGEEDEQRIAAICASLDGLPLAIELAAGRAAQLGAARVEALLADRFALLAGGVRRARPRQRTLEATMDWSYDLLGDDERVLLGRLSVIAGPVDPDVALGIGADDTGEARAAAALTSLADKSLLVVGSPLLETVRDYAATKLAAAGETASARDRHLQWHLDVVDGLVERASLDEARARLEPRLADLDVARTWAIDRGAPEAAAALAARVWPVHVLRLELSEAQRWLDVAAEQDDALSMDDRLRWRVGTMWTAGARADALAGLSFAGEVVALAPPGHPLRVSALAFQAQAVAHLDAAEARRLLEVAWREVDRSHPEQPVQLRTIEALTHLSDLDLLGAAEAFDAAASSETALPGYFGRSALVLRPLCLHLAGAGGEALEALEVAAQLSGVDDTFLQAIVRAYVHATVRPNAAALRALLGTIDDRDPVAMTQPFAVAAAAELARSDGDTALADQLFRAMAAHRWHSRHEGLAAHVRTRLDGHESVSTGATWSTVDLVDQARRLAQA